MLSRDPDKQSLFSHLSFNSNNSNAPVLSLALYQTTYCGLPYPLCLHSKQIFSYRLIPLPRIFVSTTKSHIQTFQGNLLATTDQRISLTCSFLADNPQWFLLPLCSHPQGFTQILVAYPGSPPPMEPFSPTPIAHPYSSVSAPHT